MNVPNSVRRLYSVKNLTLSEEWVELFDKDCKWDESNKQMYRIGCTESVMHFSICFIYMVHNDKSMLIE